jgi:polysaccharide export outer membrane protein
MKKYKINQLLFLLLLAPFVLSCVHSKHIAYYQNIDQISSAESVFFEPKIQSDDLLMIIVSAADSEAAIPFNLETTIVPSAIGQGGIAQRQQQLYLVDKDGMIDFPVFGQLKIGGKTKSEIIKMLKEKLLHDIKNPIINMRIMNYKVTIQGEVNKPGSYNVNSERITLPEALSLAGDLTIYGKRDNVIIVREENGKRTYNRVDITKADFINTPFYYLSQNDLIYVEPNKAKSNTSTIFNQNIPVWISIASLVSSAIFSIILINKN